MEKPRESDHIFCNPQNYKMQFKLYGNYFIRGLIRFHDHLKAIRKVIDSDEEFNLKDNIKKNSK